jgi:hypothetical protein
MAIMPPSQHQPSFSPGQIGAGPLSSGTLGATLAKTEKESFTEFLKEEIEYHEAMKNVYEHLLAADVMRTEDDMTGKLLRQMIIAGIRGLSGEKT